MSVLVNATTVVGVWVSLVILFGAIGRPPGIIELAGALAVGVFVMLVTHKRRRALR